MALQSLAASFMSAPFTASHRFEVFAFVNQKGGVAKTTTAVNLAAAFTRLGKRILLLDLDPQGHAGLGLGIDIHADVPTMYDALILGKNINEVILPTYIPGLYVAPSNIQLSTADLTTSAMVNRNILLKKALRQISQEFDLVLLDCPPTIGVLTYNALIACTKVFVPMEMDFYALEGMSQLIDTIRLVNEVRDNPIDVSRVIITKYERNTRVTQAALNNISEFFGNRVCKTFIRKNTTLREAPAQGKAIIDYAPNSTGAYDYMELAKELLRFEEFVCAASSALAQPTGQKMQTPVVNLDKIPSPRDSNSIRAVSVSQTPEPQAGSVTEISKETPRSHETQQSA